MVRLYYAYIRTANVGSMVWPALPEWKLRELLRQRDGGQRRLSLLGYAVLAERTGADLTKLKRDAHGKPYLPGGPAFSLAHTRGLAVCALAPDRVGVDVERLDALEHPADVRDWTARESYGKCIGVGAAVEPDSPPLWMGALPGGFWAAVSTGGRSESISVKEWKCGQ